MKHLKKFEHFGEQEKINFDKFNDTKEELENSSTFKEMPEKEQEVLSDAYSDEIEEINIKEKCADADWVMEKITEIIDKDVPNFSKPWLMLDYIDKYFETRYKGEVHV